ncbi:hypothetical protein [Alteromonas gilva]|uniref:Uncharacterized protein n=1 Tax=Alteromonas gilva TaxID=2987522 RepID=A0ABT5L771_9ALTE|nr:hypothetical protein [Alteromonas gilva]MDC8832269.1 hypothetical protein [Alteromonas gilva]
MTFLFLLAKNQPLVYIKQARELVHFSLNQQHGLTVLENLNHACNQAEQ